MYQVLARKWRPQRFEDVIGQDHVVATLQNALKSGKIGHAYLFSGPRGSGKTTVARLLAKALNCEKGPTPAPCNSCTMCKEIREGHSLDVIEIDAASNRGIDEIRELREEVRYAPARGRFKVFIIDEVHMLTVHAFNALLKTLEEPPSFIVFIMATTEKKKVLPTIVSRCQPFDFRKISHQTVVQEIKRIAGEEDLKINEEGINTIVGYCDGSMRDALSTLDKLISFCGKNIQEDQIKTVLGFADRELIEEFIGAIAASDVEKVLKLTAKIQEQGQDMMIFFFELLSYYRNLILVKSVENVDEITFIPEDELKKLNEFAQSFSLEDLLRIFQILIDSEEKLKKSTYPRYIFEATSVKLASLVHLEPIENLIRSLRGESVRTDRPDEKVVRKASATTGEPRGARNAEAESQIGIETSDLRATGEQRRSGSPGTTAGTRGVREQQATVRVGEDEKILITSITPFEKMEEDDRKPERPADITEVIIEKVKSAKPFLNLLLGNAHLKISGRVLEIYFTELSPIFQERLEDKDTIALIERISSEVYGERLRVKFLAPQKEKAIAEERPEAKEQAKRKVLFKEVSKEPLVQKFIEQFDATITDIKELKLMKEVDNGKSK
ncbi:MAG: DNA polymerase III subunit gamma/tau [Acidobacteriota bacterium]